MRRIYLLGAAALAISSAWAVAQDTPESLLPRMFEDPAPAPSPAQRAPRPAASPSSAAQPRPTSTSTPVVQPIGDQVAASAGEDKPAEREGVTLKRLPTLEELAKMSPEDFEALIGRKVEFDMPPQARRSVEKLGLLGESEGGFPASSLSGQNGALIRVALLNNNGAMVSRWGHILLRRALLSRLDPPDGMTAQEFLAMRVALLLRMGEADAARAILQDIDIPDYTPELGSAALDVYTQTADFTGLCPVMATQGSLHDEAEWNVARTMCDAFRGNSAVAISALDRDLSRGTMPRIDLLLAQRYAGSAGKSRRAVTIEWDKVTQVTPWRYGLAIGVGLEPPASLMEKAGQKFSYITALAPMVSLQRRAAAADVAGASGVLSNGAMVDLYAQIYADPDVSGDWQGRAESLHDAYTLQDAGARIAAMQALWNGAQGGQSVYARKVLTASAAARVAPSVDLEDSAPGLVGSMLAAGYDANAVKWLPVVQPGTDAWAMIVLAAPGRGERVGNGDIDRFIDEDDSTGKRKGGFLVAGLAGLGRIDRAAVQRYSNEMSLGFDGSTRWIEAIDHAAGRGDQATVAMLAAFGMQGRGWGRMTPRYLLHIVSALQQVGLDAEARMIAAEAIARS